MCAYLCAWPADAFYTTYPRPNTLVLLTRHTCNTFEMMKSLTVRLPDQLVMEIEAESRNRHCPKSDIVRERLQRGAAPAHDSCNRLSAIADLVGSVEGLPA